MRLYLLFVGLFLLAGCDGRRDRVVVDVAQKGDRCLLLCMEYFLKRLPIRGMGAYMLKW